MFRPRILTMVLAGGTGERLRPLTYRRCKPAVPFGGNFRVIDFTLINCACSNLRQIYVLTQYQSATLDRHCRERWRDVAAPRGDHMRHIRTLPPRLNGFNGSYRGTADAIYQNLVVLRAHDPGVVLILSGDHVYHANYDELVRTHRSRRADVTILTGEVSTSEASSFGVLATTGDHRVTRFVEKPFDPSPYARDGKCVINLGVYCFRTGFLTERLVTDARNRRSSHDFGKDILPASLGRGAVVSCPLRVVCPDSNPYWRDVGTIDSFFDSHLDLLRSENGFELTDSRWSSSSRFRGWLPQNVPARARIDGRSIHGSNLIADRVHLAGAQVVNSVLSTGVSVGEHATLNECVLFPGAKVGRGAKLRRVIVEEGVTVPPGMVIGYRSEPTDRAASPAGVVVFAGDSRASDVGRPTPRSASLGTSHERTLEPRPAASSRVAGAARRTRMPLY